MAAAFDLDAYLVRIGYDGPRAANLATLSAIHGLQVATIPFENLTPLMGQPVLLDLEALQTKLVGARRGGYCFELNALFGAALEALGFAVTGLAGRVRWMAPPEAPMGPRSHMVLRVDLPDGPYLADAGFGGHLLDAPLKLVADIEQASPAALHRIIAADAGALMLQTRLPTGWQNIYRFTLEAQFPADYQASNWFTSTHPTSLFVSNLLAERLTSQARYSLFNQRLIERWRDGRTVERTISNAEELGEVLGQALNLTPSTSVEDIWAKLPSP